MSALSKAAFIMLAAAPPLSVWLPPPACASDAASWNGQYILTLSASAKAGTSGQATRIRPPD